MHPSSIPLNKAHLKQDANTNVLDCATKCGWQLNEIDNSRGIVTMSRFKDGDFEFGVYDFKSSPSTFRVVRGAVEIEINDDNWFRIFE